MRNLHYPLYALLAVIFTFIIHEFAHWSMGELLGYDMVMTLNTVYPVKGIYNADWHYTLISAVGPLTTLLEAVVCYLLIKTYSTRHLYPFLFTCFYIELLSGIMNLRHPNDLGRISTAFGLGLLTIPAISIFIHAVMVFKTSKREQYPIRVNLATLWIMLFSSVWILSNQLYKIILIGQ